MEKKQIDEIVLDVVAEFERRRDVRSYIRAIFQSAQIRLEAINDQKVVQKSLVRLRRDGKVQTLGTASGTRYYLSNPERRRRQLPEDPYKHDMVSYVHLDAWPTFGPIELRGIFLEAWFRAKYGLRPTSYNPDFDFWCSFAGKLIGTHPPKKLAERAVQELVQLGFFKEHGNGFYQATAKTKEMFGCKFEWYWQPNPAWRPV